ncbi:MAG: hypothetical protein ACYTDY_08295 [Planctomycetota bacterium]|jgi:TRAP-type C4-dicarboxylate transport system permease large subunit
METKMDPAEFVREEISRHRGMLLYAERQKLKRGEHGDLAKTLLKRMRRAFWGLAMFIVLLVFRFVVDGRDLGRSWYFTLSEAVIAAVWLGLLAHMAYGWGRLSGSMDAVLRLLGEEPSSRPASEER